VSEFPTREDFAVEVLEVGAERRKVAVLDAVFQTPKALVDHAADEAAFSPLREAGNFYPGIRAPAPKAYAQALFEALKPVFADIFGVDVEGRFKASAALSLATLAPQQLNTAQRLPHIDTTDHRQFAVLHYLCDPRHGGTAFYRHRSTGFESIDEDRAPTFYAALKHELDTAGPPPPEYVVQSTPLFEQTARVEARFDRILVYRSRMLHSGLIDPTFGLSEDPRLGRLTANSFVTFERAEEP
jgi:hypothetical protein